MSSIRPPDEEELGMAARSVLDAERRDLPSDQRLPYLTNDYWRDRSEAPCWVSLNLKKFYQTVNLEVIRAQFREAFPDDPELGGSLLDNLLRFRLDLTGFSGGDLLKRFSV